MTVCAQGNPVTTAVLSPHLDDAVLSCWHVLEGHDDVVVVNVFTGSPPAGTPVPAWDRLTGARDPVARMRERRAEDRRALGLVGRDAVGLGLLDAQYRHAEPSAQTLATMLAQRLRPGTILHAPAGLSGPPDHALVRDAALELARDGWPLVIYADLPHGITRGWPAWVTGTAEPGDRAVGTDWAAVLTTAGLDLQRLVPGVRPLDEHARARKLRALAEYRTQRVALDRLTFVPLADPRALAFEVAWRVPASALDAAHERGGEAGIAEGGGEPLHDGR
jgi:LmbE family N-acetylglucosaminyl deacetylase